MDKDKALRRGLRWLGLAIIAAILSGASQSEFVAAIWFVLCVGFAFGSYIYLLWEG